MRITFFVYRLLPDSVVKWLKASGVLAFASRLLLSVELAYFRFITAVPFFSSVHYGLLSSSFRREHHGVARGKKRYLVRQQQHQLNRYLLRRNIHRLEKGLLMRPRRPVFAVDYIGETVTGLQNAIQSEDHDEGEIKWACDVLQAYFQAVSLENTAVLDAKNKFDMLTIGLTQTNDCSFIPYARDLTESPTIDYKQLLALAERRRSVRWYRPQLVPRKLVDQALHVAGLSPSACNRQPFEFRIYDDPDLIGNIGSLPLGTAGFYPNFPMIIVIVGKLEAYFRERDRHLIYIDSSLAAMSFMFALETLGLSSCAINWGEVADREQKMCQLLHLEPDERPIMLMSVGYADESGLVAYSQKRDLDHIRSYNKL